MPDWFDKARQTITRRPGGTEPEPFERICVCGDTVGGERRPQAQEVTCPGCGREWFVLPLDPYPRPRVRSARPPLWKKLRSGGTPNEAPVEPTAAGRSRGSPRAAVASAPSASRSRCPPARERLKASLAAAKQSAQERVKRAARPLRLIGTGILALAILTGAWLWHRARIEAASATLVSAVPDAERAIQGRDFATAQRLYAEAAAAVDVLGAQDATAARVRQRNRELITLTGLAAQTPYDLAAQAERLVATPQSWSDQFLAVHAGRWIVLDVSLGEPEAPLGTADPAKSNDKAEGARDLGEKVIPLDLPLTSGKFPVRFEIDAAFFESKARPDRAIFSAQYQSWKLHRGPKDAATWVVTLRPDTAFLWCSPDLYASLGFDLDAEVDPPRSLLARQSKEAGVPVDGEASSPAQRRNLEVAKEPLP